MANWSSSNQVIKSCVRSSSTRHACVPIARCRRHVIPNRCWQPIVHNFFELNFRLVLPVDGDKHKAALSRPSDFATNMGCATEPWDFHAVHYIALKFESPYNKEIYFIPSTPRLSIHVSKPHNDSTLNRSIPHNYCYKCRQRNVERGT
jgi:hypothetical protein